MKEKFKATILFLFILLFILGCNRREPSPNAENFMINETSNFLIQAFEKIESDGFERIKFGTDKKKAKVILRKEHPEIMERSFTLQYFKGFKGCTILTIMTFLNNGPFKHVELALICKKTVNLKKFTNLIENLFSKAKERFGVTWRDFSNTEGEGYYSVWKTSDSYLSIGFTPGRKFKHLWIPIDIKLGAREGISDLNYMVEMKETYGF